MKLHSFWIKQFRNIEDKTLYFGEGNYTTLVGLNGSGKSNWLEALANIFMHLYEKTPFDFDFKIVFEIDGKTYTIDSKSSKNRRFQLPDSIIACYSGEDSRLWQDCFVHSYNNFYTKMLGGTNVQPYMLYLNKYSWDIALITLLCSEDEQVVKFIKRIFGIQNDFDKRNFKVDFRLNKKNLENFKETNVKKLLLDYLNNKHVIQLSEISSLDIDEDGDNKGKCRKLYFMLYSALMPDAIGNNNIKRAIESIDITYEGLNAHALSEGNKKQILIELATKILGTPNTLFLFDEPDAHSHIAAKEDIFKLVNQSEGYSVVSTHSPSFISKMNPKDLRTVVNGNPQNIENIISTIAQVSGGEISYIEGALITTKKNILAVEGKYDAIYIREAIEKLSPQYDQLNNIYILPLNGASAASYCLENIISPMQEHLNKVLFVFDKDNGGNEGKKSIMKYLKDYEGKLNCISYLPDYKAANEYNGNFFVEDYFQDAWKTLKPLQEMLNTVQEGKYCKIKTLNEFSSSIKSNIESHYKEFDIKYWNNFKPFLNELMSFFFDL